MNRENVINIIDVMTPVVGNDNELISVVLGAALGSRLSVAVEEKKYPCNTYYMKYFMIPVRNFISQFNERRLINVEAVEEVTRAVFEYRYNLANPEVRNAGSSITVMTPLKDILDGFSVDGDKVSSVCVLIGAIGDKVVGAYNEANSK